MNKNAVYIGSEIYRRSSFGHNHPLSYARQESILDMCKVLGWLPEGLFLQSPKAGFDTLIRYHDEDYVRALQSADQTGLATPYAQKNLSFWHYGKPIIQRRICAGFDHGGWFD